MPKIKTLQRRHIEALISVADQRSVHAAAREIGMPQPALSRLISEAEFVMGERLFDRSSHGCAPTLQGQAVLAQARYVLRGLEQLGSMVSVRKPAVHVGCIPRAMYTLVPRLLNLVFPPVANANQAADSAPPFELIISEGSSAKLMEDLSQGKLDFAVLRSVSGPPHGMGDIQIQRLYDDKIVIIGSAEHHALTQRASPLKNMMKERWVLPEPTTTSRIAFDNFLREHNLPAVKAVMEVRSFEANLALVAGTGFLSIAPESIARRYLQMGLRIVPVKPALPSSPVMLAYNVQHLDSQVLSDFRKLLLRSIRPV